jgi:hypothetical protein
MMTCEGDGGMGRLLSLVDIFCIYLSTNNDTQFFDFTTRSTTHFVSCTGP